MMWEAVARVLDGSQVNHDAATDGVARLLKQQAALEAKVSVYAIIIDVADQLSYQKNI